MLWKRLCENPSFRWSENVRAGQELWGYLSNPVMPSKPACQLQEELVATWVPGLGQYLLYQCWGELTLESTLFKALLVILIPALFRNHRSRPLHSIVNKTEAQRKVICLRSPGLETKFSDSVQSSFYYPSLIRKPNHMQDREGGGQPTTVRCTILWKELPQRYLISRL